MRGPFLLVLLLFLLLVASSVFSSPCHRECDTRLSLDEDDFDVACNETCKIQKCYEGCDLWTEAVSSTCHDVCEEETKVFKKKSSSYCVRGCSIAINIYIESIEEKVGTPAAPYLFAETPTNTSISIAWTHNTNSSSLKNISYLVQLRYDGLHSSDWEYYQPFKLLKNNSLKVERLQPYTKYRFRVAWILLTNYPPLFSEESFVISTLPYGVPTTSPTITCLTAVSCCRVSVSWNPPTQPNGPILSYVLYITEYPSGNIMIKDVSDTTDGLHYMINNLKPATSYVISLSTRNTMGEGPADVRNVTTLPEKEPSNLSYPPAYLVYAAKQRVLKQGLRLIDMSDILYEAHNDSITITGIALHVKENVIFASDSEGSIHSFSLKERKKIETIMERSKSYPNSLSLDWLNEKLYMAEENQISRCDLNGNNYTVLVSYLESKPYDLHVDPLNGYLYWIMRDVESSGGLYRLDLIEFELGSISSTRAELIISDNLMMAFAVDYKNFRLLIPSATNNTIMSVALDGSDVADIRLNSQTSRYANIKSMAVHQNVLFFTTGTELLREEYQKEYNLFFLNLYTVKDAPIFALNIHHPDNQPHPVPLNPVESLEVLFGNDRAKIRWSRPRRLAGEGKGSYKKWLYEVNVFENGKELAVSGSNISQSVYYVEGLKPNMMYSVKLRAYSLGGNGPWSSEFYGSTLDKNNNKFPIILWGAQEGLLKSNAIGEDVKLLVPKINFNNARITDICAYEKMLFINTNTSYVYTVNTSIRNSLTRLQNISMASGIALDWLAPKLYWSSPVQQIISRSNLDGTQPEPLPILAMAREIAVDSVRAHLYFATSHSVERARLNGRDHFVYMENALFSGKHVMGLTLDFNRMSVYWMVRSFEGSILYRSCLANWDEYDCRPEEPDVVGELFQEGLYGPFWYFSNRLYWLDENQRAFVSDINAKYLAKIDSPGLTDLSSIGIIDPSLQPYPEGFTRYSIKVVPLSVPENSIFINGTSEHFNITWNPDTSVNYGTVFYEIRVDDGDEVYNLVTNETVFVYPTMKYLSPHTYLTIAVQAFTFYASARQTVAYRHSPMSIPSKPIRPRVFITHNSLPKMKNENIVAIYRWLAPNEPNGVIKNYRVTCWYIKNEIPIPDCDDMVSGATLEFESIGLLPNTTYYFQVRGVTEAGEGPPSDITEAKTSEEKPIPQLLLSNTEGVVVADIDSQKEQLLYGNAVHPAAIAYLAQDRRVFWMEAGALMVSSMDGTSPSQIKRLSSEGTCLTVDWVGRNLYWAEVNKTEGNSNIMSVGLTNDSNPIKVLNYSSAITSLEVEPFSGSLIWTVTSENSYNLMISDLTGSNVRPFFTRSLEYESISSKLKVKRMTSTNKSCNCPPSTTVSSAITIDTTNASHPQILFVDGTFGHIWASDIEGCVCNLMFNATENKDSGLPPTSLTADKATIYWSNETLGKMYCIPKSPRNKTSRFMEKIDGIRTIRAIGPHLQPLPHSSCLLPEPYKKTAELRAKFSHSLLLYLPPIQRPKHCSKISFSSILYNVYYEISGTTFSCFDDFMKDCRVASTRNNTITLNNLEPYTNYTIRVSVQNHYSEGKLSLGPSVEYRTDEGVPSVAVNVTAISVTPNRIDVSWEPPLYPHGPSVSYEVFWTVKGSSISTFYSVHSGCGNYSTDLMMVINTAEPGEEHYIFVRAYSSSCLMYSDSEEVSVTAFSLPHNLTLYTRTSISLILEWIPPNSDLISNFHLKFRETDVTAWRNDTNISTASKGRILFELQDLIPKSKYNVKLILTYREKGAKFIWPKISSFGFITAGDVPSTPGKPQLKLSDRDVYEVFWYSSINYGYENMIYELQQRSESSDEHLEEWILVYNSSQTEWIMEGISSNVQYEFRIRALNEYGYSNYSYSEKPFYLPETGAYIDPPDDPIGIVVASCIVTAILLILILSPLYIIHMKKREKNKKILQDIATSNQLVPDLELATLQDLPLHANFIHQTNALYNLSDLPTDEELNSLPQVQRDQIKLTKFLGRGMFGEVFEGVVYGLNEETPSLKIAVKTLKKGASDHEKEEFLKEAKLMSNFKHDHVLQLLGVCLDNNPNFIILELMEGGDLLSFLRNNRPTMYQSSSLTMDDLMGICIDVAKGCKYLEDMHFVHRDLAARNCLVSSYDRNERVVKIGDFGLARDIYKNDYYRKEGEALLPVRWMAPESLIYGVFTTHSDVWSFGVLLWEVITLGQQPYPARSNMEVLYYVRNRGILEKPENCPEDLHEVMVRCWNYDAESRPTFYSCLNALKELKDKLVSSTVIMPSVYNYNYLGDTNLVTASLGFDNLGYCGSELVEVSIPNTQIVDETIPGTYIGQNEFEEDPENKLTDQFLDSRSTQSDPAAPEMPETNTTSLRRSSSWSSAMFDLPSSSFSSATRMMQNSRKKIRNKYLELLGDNEDADGYQLPLPLHSSKRADKFNLNDHHVSTNDLMLNSVVSNSFSDQFNVLPVAKSLTTGFQKCTLNVEEIQTCFADTEEDSNEINQEITSETESYPSWLEDCDSCSVSTASTATYNFDVSIRRNSGASILSSISGIDLNYASQSSIC